MRLCIILACWLYGTLATAEPLRVGLENHDYYPYSNLFERAPIAWPSGKAVAVAIVVARRA